MHQKIILIYTDLFLEIICTIKKKEKNDEKTQQIN